MLQVWGSLLSNVLSILLGVAGLVYVGLLFASELPSSRICGSQPRSDTSYPYDCSYKLQYLDVSFQPRRSSGPGLRFAFTG